MLLERYQKAFENFLSLYKKLKDKEGLLKQEYLVKINNQDSNRNRLLNLENSNYQEVFEKLQENKLKFLGEINRYELIFSEGSTKFGKITPEIAQNIADIRNIIIELIQEKVNVSKETFSKKKDSIVNEFESIQKQIGNKFEIDRDELLNEIEILIGNACVEETNIFEEKNPTKSNKNIEEGISYFDFKNYSDYFNVGKIEYSSNIFDNEIRKDFNVIIPFINQKSVLLIHDQVTENYAECIQDNLLIRSLLSTEVGKMKLILCDLKGTGEFYREFIPLNPDVATIAYGRQQLEEILKNVNDIIQANAVKHTASSHFSNFESIGEYNNDKIIKKNYDAVVPHYIITILNLSFDIDENLMRKLRQTIQNGKRNGVNFIITWQPEDIPDKGEEILNYLLQSKDVLCFDFVGDKSNYFLNEYSIIPNELSETKKQELVASFNSKYEESSKNVTKITFKEAVPQIQNWFKKKSGNEIIVPIGASKDHRGEQNIVLKTGDLQSHVLMSGGTGSGKTNFLKTFITSACINYSPNELELYLIDLKNGIGFNIFNEKSLPHTKLYALGAENELILNLFTTLNDEMNRRFNLFRDEGVEDIDKFKNKNPNHKMPRVLVIIDEFSTIFEDDNPYQDEICAKISPLAKKARAAGINLFFSTQNFGNTRSFKNLMSEIPVRILLKSSPAAASAIIDTRNNGLKNVKTVGDGFVNYNLGITHTDEDNQFFKSYLLDNEDLESILDKIHNECKVNGFSANENIVYNNLTNADFNSNFEIFDQERLRSENEISRSRKQIPLWLGEPATISKSHFSINLEKNFYENILITGIYKDVNINAVYNIISSLSYLYGENEIGFRVVSFLTDDENKALKMHKLDKLGKEYDYKFIDSSNLNQYFTDIEQEYEYRKNNSTKVSKPLFLIYIGLEKANLLFKEDFSTYSKWGTLLGAMLENSISTNIYNICECRLPSILDRILRAGSYKRFFKHKISFHLGNSEESADMFGSRIRIAGSLHKSDEPHTKTRGIYMNSDFESDVKKFKPYIDLIDSDVFYPNNFGISNNRPEAVFLSCLTNDQTMQQQNDQNDLQDQDGMKKQSSDMEMLLEKLKEIDDDEILDVNEFLKL